jgi:hypothetical protein
MSKKSKRQSRKVSAAASRNGLAQAASAQATPVQRSSGSSMFEVEFKPDYSQTIKDLRRIGILAGTFISILVILSFFLR